MAIQVFLIPLLAMSWTLLESKKTQVLFNTKPLLAFTNSSLNEYKYSITLNEWIKNKAQIQDDFA